MSFNERLSQYFKNKGISQKSVAETMGYKTSYLNHFFRNREPNWELIEKLVHYYPEIDMNFLIKGNVYDISKVIASERTAGGIHEPNSAYKSKYTLFLDSLKQQIENFQEVSVTELTRNNLNKK
jgi:transcriptional regulator with XRE-family HTH domain